jgi:hypothetical protein
MSLPTLVLRFENLVRGIVQPTPHLKPIPPFPVELEHVRHLIEPNLVLLCLIARADRDLPETERSTIVRHCLELPMRHDIVLDRSDAALLRDYIEEFRPSSTQLDEALHIMAKRDAADLSHFISAAYAVVLADDVIHGEELAELSRMATELEKLGAKI